MPLQPQKGSRGGGGGTAAGCHCTPAADPAAALHYAIQFECCCRPCPIDHPCKDQNDWMVLCWAAGGQKQAAGAWWHHRSSQSSQCAHSAVAADCTWEWLRARPGSLTPSCSNPEPVKNHVIANQLQRGSGFWQAPKADSRVPQRLTCEMALRMASLSKRHFDYIISTAQGVGRHLRGKVQHPVSFKLQSCCCAAARLILFHLFNQSPGNV